MFERVEVALRWANAKGRSQGWIRQPSRELGIEGFDDLWLSPEDVPIAEYVPREPVAALRTALAVRARSQGERAAERDAVADQPAALEEVDVDAIDTPLLAIDSPRDAGLV
jgi:hypothetical protein